MGVQLTCLRGWRMGSTIVTLAAVPGILAALFWMAQLVEAIRFRMQAVWLSAVPVPAEPPGAETGEDWPSVAIVFAARNEAVMVERATRSFLKQDYPALQVIAVDDRSTDGTGTILESIAASDARLKVVHIHELPAGWLGK